LLRQFEYWREQGWHTKFLRWSTDNLSSGKKPLWKHGRGWLYLNGRCVFSMEWNPGNRHFCTLHIDWGGGDTDQDLSLTFGFPFIGFYSFSLDGLLPEWLIDGDWVESMARPGRKLKLPIARKIGLSIHDGTIWFSIWSNPMEWRSKQPWWWEFNFNPADFFLGRQKYSAENMEAEQTFITLPEGHYPVKVTLFESTWKRPRWPWPKKMIRAEIDCGEHGIPSHAGKGENDWDLEDDLTYSMTCPASTVEQAVQMLQDSLLRDRKRYGNPTDLLKQRGLVHA
jgi:hypothetical protein